MNRRRLHVSLLSVLLFVVSASAMDRWAALSMIESGDNDRAVGAGGEVSRFQIKPILWNGGNPLDAQAALSAAMEIMKERVAEFERIHKRAPNDVEFYILWNAPSRVNKPSPVVSERANRFANLIKR